VRRFATWAALVVGSAVMCLIAIIAAGAVAGLCGMDRYGQGLAGGVVVAILAPWLRDSMYEHCLDLKGKV
jgi:hypothetical protein